MSYDRHEPGAKPAETHAWLQALFDESPMAISFSRDGVNLDANPALARLFGYEDGAALRGRSILDLLAASDRPRVAELVARRAHGGATPQRYQARGLRRDGREFPFEITLTRVVVADGPLTIAFLADVSEREEALQALQASEEMFRTLSSAAVEGVFVHAAGKILLTNDAGAAMYGYASASAMIGLSLMDCTAPASRPLVAAHIARGAREPYEGLALRRDGSTFLAEVRGRTLERDGGSTRVAIIRDVTEARRAEAERLALTERVRHAQKLESLGLMAGGVAHDFNNILTVITHGVALAKREALLGAVSVGHLDAIALAAERAADLCRQMLAYAGKGALAREAIDLSALVGEMATMLEASIARKVSLVRDLAPGLPLVVGDATQLRQIVMNLVINASEAIAAPRGAVEVRTLVADVDAAAASSDRKPGRYVVLDVRDDGVGMNETTVAQMFDPFFTTKLTGRGLGMAAVLGIVRAHAGAIDVESHPGRGTRIRVSLPASREKPVAPPPARAAEEPRGEGVVLVVDDEKNVRVSTQLLLQELGYEVVVAADGLEAIAIFEAQAARLGAVLLDLTMPRMDGLATLRELRKIAPRVPVILTSGYGAARLEDSQSEMDASALPDDVLPKPYTVDHLLAALRRVMRATAPPR